LGCLDTDADIDSLIEKTEKEGDKVEEHGPSMTFSFAKIWASDKDGTEEMADTAPESAEADSWAQTLQRIASEKEQVQAKEVTGRGAKRKAAAVFPQVVPLFVPLSLQRSHLLCSNDSMTSTVPASRRAGRNPTRSAKPPPTRTIQTTIWDPAMNRQTRLTPLLLSLLTTWLSCSTMLTPDDLSRQTALLSLQFKTLLNLQGRKPAAYAIPCTFLVIVR
jgi:hypothetical protein